MSTMEKAVRVMESTRAVASDKVYKAIKAIMPSVAEAVSFLIDCTSWLSKDHDAWKKPRSNFCREFIHEMISEYAVVVDNRNMVCRKITRIFAIRGTNRREFKYDVMYREPTGKDRENGDFQKVWNKNNRNQIT